MARKEVTLLNLSEVVDRLRDLGCTMSPGNTGEIYIYPPEESDALRPFQMIGPEWKSIDRIPAEVLQTICRKLDVTYPGIDDLV